MVKKWKNTFERKLKKIDLWDENKDTSVPLKGINVDFMVILFKINLEIKK